MIKTSRWIDFWVMLILMAGLLTVWGPASPGQPVAARPGVMWEYKTDFAPTREPNDELLNRRGQERWELVAVLDDPINRGDGLTHLRYVFKRLKKS